MGNANCSCWDFLMPSPESMAAKAGSVIKDLHWKSAPANSLLLLGHVELQVPVETPAMMFYSRGMTTTFVKPEDVDKQMRFFAGLSHLRVTYVTEENPEEVHATHGAAGFDAEKGRLELLENLKRCDPFFYEGKDQDLKVKRLGNGADTSVWPGEMRFWTEDTRQLYDTMNAMKSEFPSQSMKDQYEPPCGEFGMRCMDPWNKNTFKIEDCPPWLVPKWRAAAPDAKNLLGLVEVTFRVKAKADLPAIADFYTKCLMGAADLEDESCVVHFSPARSMHQSLKFVVDPATGSGTVCLYAADEAKFKAAWEACRNFARPAKWEVVDQLKEFKVDACHNPNGGAAVAPLKHIIRSPTHKECPVKPMFGSQWLSSRKLG